MAPLLCSRRVDRPVLVQVLPAVGTLLLFGVVKAGLFDVPDPAFLFVCLCMFPVPTAINMQTIANIHR